MTQKEKSYSFAYSKPNQETKKIKHLTEAKYFNEADSPDRQSKNENSV
jgi:hypothetical protein